MARPQWQIDWLFLESAPRLEALCALCGRDLDPDERDAERQVAAGEPFAAWPELDTNCQRAEKHLLAAFRAGDLTLIPGTDRTMDYPFGNYHVRPGVLIRWATKTPGRFPLFPFTAEDLPGATLHYVPEDLPPWLPALLDIWRKAKDGAAQKEITALIQTNLEVRDKRGAQAMAAFIRPKELAAEDGRAAKRRRDS